MSSSLKPRARAGLRWTALLALVTQGGRLLLMLWLARIWSAADFGIAALTFTGLNFLLFFVDAGMSNALVQRQEVSEGELSTIFWLSIFSGCLLGSLLVVSAGWAADFFYEPALRKALPVAALSLLLAPIGAPQRALWRKQLRFDALAKSEIAGFFLNAVCTVWLALKGYGYMAMIWAASAGWAVLAVAAFIGSPRADRPTGIFRLGLLRQWWSFSLYQLGGYALNYLTQRMDALLIGRMLGSASLGVYDVVKQMLSRPESLINPVVTSVAFPVMARQQADKTFVNRVYLQLLRYLSALNFPVYIFLALVAEPFLQLILGNQWKSAAFLFQLLAIFYLLHSTFNPIGSLLWVKGEMRRAFFWNLVLLISIPVTVTVSIQFGKLQGAALGLGGLYVMLQLPFFYWFIRPLTGLKATAYFGTFVRPLAVSVFSLAGPVGLTVFNVNGPWIIVPAGFLYFGLYGLASWFVQRDFLIELKKTLHERKPAG